MSKDEQIFELYKLLDDIDTLDDAAKDDHMAFRERTENIAEALSDEDWQFLGQRKRRIEAQLTTVPGGGKDE